MTDPTRRFLEFFYFDAGGGHRSAATALQAVIAERYPYWDVRLVNLQKLLQPVDPIFRVTKISSEDVYNKYLKTGLTYGSRTFLRAMQGGIRINADKMKACLEEHWHNSHPDLVVSLIPNFNAIMFGALQRVHRETPYITIMTDLADTPPHFWQERQEQFMICGSEMATRQARQKGYTPEHIFQTSGMIIKPNFYRGNIIDRKAGREALGLDPHLPTALIMFGGYGSKTSLKIVERLRRSDLQVQCIVMCGHNDKLRHALHDKPLCHAVGFTDDVPHYMQLADFFIGKPGPGSVSEAIHMGLPVIIEHNHRTMVQERFNATWVEQQKLGITIRNFRQISKVVRSLFDEGRLEHFRENARHINNYAVFEIPKIFDQIMNCAEKKLPHRLPDTHIISTIPHQPKEGHFL